MRRAMTLLEVVMAVGLFTVIITLVLQALTGMRRFTISSADRMNLSAEANDVLKQLATSFSNSAWYISPKDGGGADTDLEKLAADATYDRTKAVYYPFIYQQSSSSLPSTGPFYAGYQRWTTPTQLVSASTYRADLWALLPDEHKLPSQEVTFLRIRAGAATTTPTDHLVVGWIDFNQTPVKMSDYRDTDILPTVQSLGLRGSGAVVSDIPLDWETYPGADPWGTYPDLGADPSELREFCYRVVPDSETGKARLERCYRDGWSGTLTVEQVISDKVDRIVVDTYRTDENLALNQIRIAVYCSTYVQQTDELQTYNCSITIALRSTVDPEYANNLQTWLGAAGSF
jgi:type II secretory pathway pseudopilin PulG